MGIRIGAARVGHRVGGFYLSAPVTGRNAGKQLRVGHRLPGGLYGSVPITLDRRTPAGRREASPRAQAIITLIVGAVFMIGSLAVGAWPLTLGAALTLGYLVLRGRANHHRAETLVRAKAAAHDQQRREFDRIASDNSAWMAAVRD